MIPVTHIANNTKKKGDTNTAASTNQYGRSSAGKSNRGVKAEKDARVKERDEPPKVRSLGLLLANIISSKFVNSL